MLTKTDLSQIQKIVHSEVQSETRKIFQEETPAIVRKIVREETTSIVQQELKPIKKDIRSIKKDINLIVRTFDRDYVTLRRKLEEHINHHPYAIAAS